MKAVDIPLVDFDTCSTQLQATRLGKNFMLDPNSFTCAGGEAAKGNFKLLLVKLFFSAF